MFGSSHVKNVFFVIDGLIYDNGIVNRDFIPVYKKLRNQGKKIFFLSNNSVFSRNQWAYLLNKEYPLQIQKEHVFNSGYISARYFNLNNIFEVYVIGERGLVEELSGENIRISKNARHVLVSIDRYLTYDKLNEATQLVLEGAKLYKTDNSVLWMNKNRKFISTSLIAAPLEKVYEKEGNVLGMPSDVAKDVILRDVLLFPEDSVLIGGSKTAMYFGSKCGFKTVFVGNLTKKDFKEYKPDKIIKNILDL